MFCEGEVASLIGHNIESAVTQLRQTAQTANKSRERFVNVSSPILNAGSRCSLLVIDRNVDLRTPLAHRTTSLAGRAHSTLPRRECGSLCPDLSSGSRLGDVYLESRCLRGAEDSPLTHPMSGLGSLRVFVSPSVTSETCQSMITQSEEQTFREVSDELSKSISACNPSALASLPSKKRGPGAETLALAQLLLAQSERAPLRLLGRAATIIEAMQRSSGKQWSQVCSWRCSFEMREARERALSQVVQAAASYHSDSSAEVASSQRLEVLTQLVRTGAWPSSDTEGSSKGRRKETSVLGPVDLEHVFNMLVSHLFEAGGNFPLGRISAFTSAVVDYILRSR